jgi:hypothetical protein
MHKKKLVNIVTLAVAMIILVGGIGFGYSKYNKFQTSKNLAIAIDKSISDNLRNAKAAINNDKLDEANKYLEEIIKVDKDNNEVKDLKSKIEENKKEKEEILRKKEEEVAAAKKLEEEKAAIIKKQEEEKAAIANASKILTKEQAIEMIKKQFPEFTSNQNLHYEYDHDSNHDGREFYVIHVYESVDNHTATMGWYGVDKGKGRIYDEMSSKYVN